MVHLRFLIINIDGFHLNFSYAFGSSIVSACQDLQSFEANESMHEWGALSSLLTCHDIEIGKTESSSISELASILHARSLL